MNPFPQGGEGMIPSQEVIDGDYNPPNLMSSIQPLWILLPMKETTKNNYP